MFPVPQRCAAVAFQSLVVIGLGIGSSRAAEGDPLAIRRWPGDTISIETYWGLVLAIGPKTDADVTRLQGADQMIDTSQSVNHVLSRKPNATEPSWISAADFAVEDVNAMRVRSLELRDGESQAIEVSVDGVRIVFVPSGAVGKVSQLESNPQKPTDLLILFCDGAAQLGEPETTDLVKSIAPQTLIVNSSELVEHGVLTKLKAALDVDGVRNVGHNSLAVSSGGDPEERQIVILTSSPWKMPAGLEELFADMEGACAESQDVFSELSTRQMNFQPSNGTHTPRWNAEHMMGRQLLFFSQIYHALDPTIPVMDLNPAQMPEDYEFAHPDWDGAEEARQMQRASDFARRFAYLLDGLPLDERPPGSRRFTLVGLLRQMPRHYREHTANTIKKFELPDWPRE